MSAASRPTLLYDDDCRFCRACAWLIVHWDRAGRLSVLPWSHPIARTSLRRVDPALRNRSMHVLDAGGRLHSPDAAVPNVLRCLPGCGWLGSAALARPWLRRALWRAYQTVARRRGQLSRLTPDCRPVTRDGARLA